MAYHPLLNRFAHILPTMRIVFAHKNMFLEVQRRAIKNP